MKKLSIKSKKIIVISIVAILLAVAIYSFIGLTRDIKENEAKQVVGLQEENEEDYFEENKEEVEIVYLNNLVITENNTAANEINTNTSTNTNNNNNNNSNNNSNTNSSSKYYIKVNCGANVVTIYTKDSEGNYTVPYKAMVCSTGTATPRYLGGKYAIKSRWRWGALFGGVYGQYCVHIVDQILFHSVPYLDKSPDSLEYWEYDKLGTSASAGCIRLTVKDVKWIYNNIPTGTIVEFYSSSNPGPLGKPTAQKISGNKECRDWDPTDPSKGNPWVEYRKKQEEKETAEKEKEDEKNKNTIGNEIKNNITTQNNTNKDTNNTVKNEIKNEVKNEIKDEVTNENKNETNKNNVVNQNSTSKENTVNKNTTTENNVKDNNTNVSNVTTNKNNVVNNVANTGINNVVNNTVEVNNS